MSRRHSRKAGGEPRYPIVRLLGSWVLPVVVVMALTPHLHLVRGLADWGITTAAALLAGWLPLLGTGRAARGPLMRVVTAGLLAVAGWASAHLAAAAGGGPVDPALEGVAAGYLAVWGL